MNRKFLKLFRALIVTFYVAVCGLATAATEVGEGQYVIFYHNDVLGSPTMVSDHNGNTLWYEHSEPYGKVRDRVATTGQEFYSDRVGSRKGYTGHLKDEGSDLVYMKARYYNPEIGRFYSEDPVGFTTDNPMMFNRYAYGNNNPYTYTDPTGENGVTAVGGFIKETSDAIGAFFENTIGFGWGDGSADYGNLAGAALDGYNGEGSGFGNALLDDASNFVPVGAIVGALWKVNKIKAGLSATNERSKKVQDVIDGITDNDFKVKVNPRNQATKQEGNVTLDFGDGTKVNLRVETHPLSQNGPPIRHGNVEVTKAVKNNNRVIRNIHITDD